jgi:hypothetical protein
MKIIDPKQMHQYYGTQVTPKGIQHTGKIDQGKVTKNLNVIDVLSVQE